MDAQQSREVPNNLTSGWSKDKRHEEMRGERIGKVNQEIESQGRDYH